MKLLEGKVALVTVAGRGLGWGIARALTKSIQSHASKYLNGFKIPIAIGGFYETVEGLCQSYKDAKLCLNMLQKIDSQ